MLDWMIDCWNEPVEMVIDGGAYVGAFVEAVLKRYPTAHIHAFEPCRSTVDKLEKRYRSNPQVLINHAGLGEAEYPWHLNVLSAMYTSSFLQPAAGSERYVADCLMRPKGTETVWVTRLDNYCRERKIEKIDVLKLDLQGYELRALEGATKILQHTRLIVCELFHMPIYEGQAEQKSVRAFLDAAGFDLLCHYSPNGYWSDALFLKRKQA